MEVRIRNIHEPYSDYAQPIEDCRGSPCELEDSRFPYSQADTKVDYSVCRLKT